MLALRLALKARIARSVPHATRETIAAQAFHFLSSSIGRNLRIATDPIHLDEVNPAVALCDPINRMLDTGRLPPRVRQKLLEYIAAKMSGAYGSRKHRLKAFANRISPVHMHAAASAFTERASTLAA